MCTTAMASPFRPQDHRHTSIGSTAAIFPMWSECFWPTSAKDGLLNIVALLRCRSMFQDLDKNQAPGPLTGQADPGSRSNLDTTQHHAMQAVGRPPSPNNPRPWQAARKWHAASRGSILALHDRQGRTRTCHHLGHLNDQPRRSISLVSV